MTQYMNPVFYSKQDNESPWICFGIISSCQSKIIEKNWNNITTSAYSVKYNRAEVDQTEVYNTYSKTHISLMIVEHLMNN